MKKFWQICAAIGAFLAYIFYILLQAQKTKGLQAEVENAEEKADMEARARNERLKNDNKAIASDIADMLDKK
jgi:hypothetical protein